MPSDSPKISILNVGLKYRTQAFTFVQTLSNLPAACDELWIPLDTPEAMGAGAMLVTTWPPVGTAADTVPEGASVIGMLTGDLLGTNGL